MATEEPGLVAMGLAAAPAAPGAGLLAARGGIAALGAAVALAGIPAFALLTRVGRQPRGVTTR